MTSIRNLTIVPILIVVMATVPNGTAVAQVASQGSRNHATQEVRTAFSHALPDLNGSQIKATLVEVTYGPGESSRPHSHPCPVIVYVIEGALRTRVKGEAEVVYKAGQSFYEAPNGIHMISANASQKVPVKFLAYFVCDHDTPLSVAPPPETLPPGGKTP